ncbi:glycosyltransferase family 61 protein [Sphingomonas piscis]|uniref:Glycosyltransferase family 61 protein n=1 Tax=Sphingomonas piscis TaxID=2714943 RepID=A0A6G7YMU2_9SPHN|nr:glycosyltransferase family 61 protein [Sphingomonas piscis]QIK78058.1 glycosyltransferase family 61 protein [Sphingomonas piscis]
MDWPEIIELQDITIGPLVGPSSKGSLTVEASPPSPALQHYRYGKAESALTILPLNDAKATTIVEEPVIYGGLMFRHFGHALTESIHRLWPRYALKELHSAKVAFNLVNNTKIMPYMTEALNFHGFSKSHVIPITEPIRFRRLFVGQQARTLAGPTTFPGYQSMLDRELSWRLPPPSGSRRLYISRLRHQHSGSFYGESFVEKALQKAGFEVVYPEDLSLTQLVEALRSAELAIFAEGSAIHALELCGSAVPDTAIISRRPASMRRFSPLLQDICERWLISDHVLAQAGLSMDRKKHSAVLALPALMRDLGRFAGLGNTWDDQAEIMAAAIDQDVCSHIQDSRVDRTDDYEVRAARLGSFVHEVSSGRAASDAFLI